MREVLRKHLWAYNVDLQSVIISTSKVKQGNKFKGGVVSYGKARNEVNQLLRDTNVVAVTTLYDLYHLPTDFPGYSTRPVGSGHIKAIHLEQAFLEDINSSRFHPHLQVHEFEAFLFVSPECTAAAFSEYGLVDKIQKIRQAFPTPEDINDNPLTSPSKRIEALYPKYDKPLYGTLAILEVGLDALRSECHHFRSWLEWLESLG